MQVHATERPPQDMLSLYEGLGLVSYGKDIDWDSLLLPCPNFDETATSPAQTCRQLIPARSYYNHIRECTTTIAHAQPGVRYTAHEDELF